MNCRSFQKRLIELLDVNPDGAAASELLEHAESCPECTRELAESQAALSALCPSPEAFASSHLKERIMSRADNLESVAYTRGSRRVPAMIARFALAAVLVLAILLGGNWLVTRDSGQPVSAFTVLAQAAEVAGGLRTIYIKANMRTLEHDNFDLIEPKGSLVPVEIWKVYGDEPKWRVGKPGRTVVMDGASTLLILWPCMGGALAYKIDGPAAGMVGWLAPLLDVETLFAREQASAREQGAQVSIAEKKGADGAPKTVLTIQAKAQGDYSESDYLRNTSVLQSDNTRVYTFDSRTHRVEGMQVYVSIGSDRTLVFETTQISYDAPIGPSVFQPEIPDDVTWCKHPDELGDVPDNSWMTPKQAAEAIFKAMADEDWDALRAFAGTRAESPDFQEYCSRLQILSVGKPFRSGMYPGWFVPYEIRLKSGVVKKFNLAIRNDNAKHQWVLDGGF